LEWEIISKTKNYAALSSVFKSTAKDGDAMDCLSGLIIKGVFGTADNADKDDMIKDILKAVGGIASAEKTEAVLMLLCKHSDGNLAPDDMFRALGFFKNIPVYCADLIYFALGTGIPFWHISSKINDQFVKTYYNGAGFKDKFSEVLLAYTGEIDCYSALWLSKLCLCCFDSAKETDGKKTVEIFRFYTKLIYGYLSDVYRPEFLDGESVKALVSEQRAGWYGYKALEAFDRGDKKTYLNCMKEAVACCESLKPVAKASAEVIREEKPVSEFDMLAKKIKENIRAYAADGNTAEALKTLEAYRQLNPNDPELPQLCDLTERK